MSHELCFGEQLSMGKKTFCHSDSNMGEMRVLCEANKDVIKH